MILSRAPDSGLLVTIGLDCRAPKRKVFEVVSYFCGSSEENSRANAATTAGLGLRMGGIF
jgi:hypothetical protein